MQPAGTETSHLFHDFEADQKQACSQIICMNDLRSFYACIYGDSYNYVTWFENLGS